MGRIEHDVLNRRLRKMMKDTYRKTVELEDGWSSENRKHLKSKKRLLVYANYYVPDVTSTGQILQELLETMQSEFDITVICAVPSYLGVIEDKYKKCKYYREVINGVKVFRVRVPEFNKENKISRIKNILCYIIGAVQATFKVGNQDYIYAISLPPIIGGLLGVWGKRANYNKGKPVVQNGHSKFIYHIQDVNPLQIEAVGYFKWKPLIWLLRKLDTFSCSQADLVVVPGRDMVESIQCRFKTQQRKMPKVKVVNNWIDEKKVFPLEMEHPKVQEFKKKYGLDNKFVFMYSGNLGYYYDLLNLLKVIHGFGQAIKTKDGRDVIFAFAGNGALLGAMKEYRQKKHMDNVVFIPYQDKKDLIYSLNAPDVHWCVNSKGIKGVSCPSKYYGIAAVGKPVLGILEEGTEIRCVIEESQGGLCCEPGDYKKIEEYIKWFIENAGNEAMLEMGKRSREYLEKNLSMEKSIGRFVDEIRMMLM